MKKFVDIRDCEPRTIEKVINSWNGQCIAIHFTDGTYTIIHSLPVCDYEAEIVIRDSMDANLLLELDLCTEEEAEAIRKVNEEKRTCQKVEYERQQLRELLDKYGHEYGI